MSGRYYCDYCDKSFINSRDALKKHIGGIHHQSLRNEHYKQFEDRRTILESELRKNPCKKIMEGNQCLFGANCRFSHYTKYQLDVLKYEIEENERAELMKKYNPISNASIETWLTSRKHRGLSNSAVLEKLYVDKIHSNSNSVTNFMQWDYPPIFNNLPELPPSLRKIDLEHFKNYEFAEWG